MQASSFRAAHRGPLMVNAVARPFVPAAVRRSSVTAKSGATATATLEAPAAAAVPVVNGVHIVTHETFESFIVENGSKTIVMDFYTDWCGPCKMIAPELEKMATAADSARLVFAKLNCGKDNDSKRLAMNLKIKALPTFKLYKNAQEVEQMTGAKVKALQALIDKHVDA